MYTGTQQSPASCLRNRDMYYDHQQSCSRMQALSVTAPSWKHPTYPTTGQWAQAVPSRGNSSRQRERMTWSSFHTNLDESHRCAVEPKKPDTEHTLHAPICVKVPHSRMGSMVTEVRSVAPWGEECGGLCDARWFYSAS